MRPSRLRPVGTAQPLTVLICHDEPILAETMTAVLERRGGIRTAAAVPSLTRLMSRLHSGIDAAIVAESVDENIPDLFEALRHRRLATPVLLVSDSPRPHGASQAFEWGAAGVISSGCDPGELVAAVRDVANGRGVVPHEIRDAVVETIAERQHRRTAARRTVSRLTVTELHILTRLAEGISIRDIAHGLGLSPHTIRSHLARLATKLGVRGQLRLASYGRELLTSGGLAAVDVGDRDSA